MKGNMASTKELSIEIIKRIVKLIQENNPSCNMAKDFGCYQSQYSGDTSHKIS